MRKLLIKSIPAGAEWITVKPNGPSSKGQPVLIMPQSDGTARVIGGAGGSLNYLKLKQVSSSGDYAQDLRDKQKKRQEEKTKQVQAEKDSGVYQERQEKRKQLKEDKRLAEEKIISEVAKIADWKPADYEFPSDHEAFKDLSPEQLEKEKRKWHGEVLRAAKDAIKDSQRLLLEDATARADAGIGEIPLFSKDENSLSVSELDPDKKPNGNLGFNPSYKDRNAENNPPESFDNEVISEAKDLIKEGHGSEAISKMAEMVVSKPELNLSGPNLSGKEALSLIAQGRKLRKIDQAMREINGNIDKGLESKSLPILSENTADLKEEARKVIYDDLRTLSTVSFLSEVGKISGDNPEETLGGYVGVGAYESLNAISLAVGGNSLIDRSVVDVLGISGATAALARRLYNDVPSEEMKNIIEGVEDFHVNSYMKKSVDSLKEAQKLTDEAAAIEISDEAQNGAELEIVQALNAERREKVNAAQKILGQSLGEMEANASVLMALKMGPQDSFAVSMGNKSEETIFNQLGALGLNDDDYKLELAGDNQLVTINSSGLDKLASPVSYDDVMATKRNIDIISGKYDENGWLPSGVAKRADLAMNTPPGTTEELTIPFLPNQDDLKSSVFDHMGSRFADGDSAKDIIADMYSSGAYEMVDSGLHDEYTNILNEISGVGTGKSLPEIEKSLDVMAAEFLSKNGITSNAVNTQKIDINQISVDALHRALSNTPQGIAAYKTVGDLSGKEIKSLKQYLAKSMAPGMNANEAWKSLVDACSSTADALRVIQEHVKSDVSETFVREYNKLNPDNALKLGKSVIPSNSDYLDNISSAIKSASESSGGDLGAGNRFTSGHKVERAIAGMIGVVGQNFKPDQPTKLWGISMDGKYINQQRAVKHFVANKRTGLAFGAGSGKTNIMLGSFAELKSTGKINRGLMLVPSIVQGQFNGEALRLLEPGKFKWDINPGASREQRLAAYKNPDVDFCVMTHQSFRDDMMYLSAKQSGATETEVKEKFDKMSKGERSSFMKEVMSKEGISFDASFVDEAHDTLNRTGKNNSSLSNVLESVSDNTPYYMYASGDPVKNDSSEIYSMMAKLDPAKYNDEQAFMRKYGVDTQAAKDSLKRELSRYVFPATISSGVEVKRHINDVSLSEGQKSSFKQLDSIVSSLKKAKKGGYVDIDMAKKLSPKMFDGADESKYVDIAKRVQNSLGIIQDSAIKRIIDQSADSEKYKETLKIVSGYGDKQGVVFAKNKATIAEYEKILKAQGKRVVVITGSDSGAEKERKKQMFNPDKGAPEADILLASDAAAVGMNLQSGQYLIQHDIPDTAKNHAQRNARIDRIGQKNGIDLHLLRTDHQSDKRAYNRLMKKYQLRDLMASPVDALDDTGIAGAIAARRAMNQGVKL